MIAKQKRKQKYSSREYTRCKICGRPHSVYKNMEYVEFALENLRIKDKSLA